MIGDSTSNLAKKYAVATVSTDKVWKLASAAAGTGATAYNFIWSDYSIANHNATSGSSSADWFNGYLIDELDLSGITMDAN